MKERGASPGRGFFAEPSAQIPGLLGGALGTGTRGRHFLTGAKPTYADLSLFQIIAGLSYAFPRATANSARKYRRLFCLHARVQELPRIAAYLASPRRIPFTNDGIFRHYPELDAG